MQENSQGVKNMPTLDTNGTISAIKHCLLRVKNARMTCSSFIV